jgi:uncharacterized membrane protein YgcG
MRRWTLLSLLCWLIFIPLPAAAQGYPAFTGQRLYLVGTQGDYSAAMAAIREVEQKSPETYYLVIVRNTGSGSWATRDYADRLYDRWSHGTARKPDPDRHILIVLGLENRQISVHAGFRLQNGLGFTGSRIDTQVVQPVFIPYARAGQIPRGLAALIPAIDRWLRRTEAELERARKEAAEQSRRARARLQELVRTERAALATLETAILRQGRAGLAVRSLQAEVVRIKALVEQAALLIEKQPDAASHTIGQATAARQALQGRLHQLGALKAEAERLRAEARERLELARGVLRDGEHRRLGAGEVQEIRPLLRQAEETLKRAEHQYQLDYAAAIQTFQHVITLSEQIIAAVNRQIAARERARRWHHFLTRVLPATAAGIAFLALLLALGWLRWRHLRLKQAVNKRLAALMGSVVELMERLERLTERHKLLTGSDRDYTAPMTGKTLELYQSTEQSLGQAWSIWNAVVLSRSEIEGLIAHEGRLGVKLLRQAEQRLGELERREEIEGLLRAVEENLDRLNQAHEHARERIGVLTQTRESIRSLLERLAAAALPGAPYESAGREVEEQAIRADGLLESDPLSARQAAEEGAQAAASLEQWLGRVAAGEERGRRLSDRIASLAQTAAGRRGEGYLLKEPNGDPDPLLAHAREEADSARGRLADGGDAEAARHLEQGEAFAARAEAVITGQVKARAFCAEDLPRRRAETERLGQHLRAARQAERALAAEFAPPCWAAVRDHCEIVQRNLDPFRKRADEAEALADLKVQHYFRASALLEELARSQGEMEARLTAVEQMLVHLRKLREDTRAAMPHVEQAVQALEAFAAANARAVRRPARARMLTARQSLQSAETESAVTAANWIAIAGKVQQAQAEAATALRAALDDVAAFNRVVGLLEEAERRWAAAADFLRRETADRPAAGQRLARARKDLDRARDEMATEGADWKALGTQVKQAIEAVDAALHMAREDVRLAQVAQAELQEAEQRLRRADRYYGYGIRGDTGSAAGLLRQASGALSGLQYETVIRLANDAAQAALAAERAAEARARAIEEEEERRREEEERRRREEEERRSRESSASMSSFSSSSFSSDPSSSSSSSFSSGSSSSSHSSGTSQSSW